MVVFQVCRVSHRQHLSEEWLGRYILEQIGFRENLSGANVWLIIPKDP